MNKTISIRKPDDMHLHLREGEMLRNVLPCTSCVFPRGVVMGNLTSPIATAEDVVRYQQEILSSLPRFDPIMSIMLTNETTVEMIIDAWKVGTKVLKFIPGNTSTNGAEGLDLRNLKNKQDVLEAAKIAKMVFSCHFELAEDESGRPVPRLDQEKLAIQYAEEILRLVPGLKMVVEHVSTKEMIDFVMRTPDNVAATITAHHAILTYDDVCNSENRIRNPHHYCKPIVKSQADRDAIRKAMTHGWHKFFFGSDSAPHPLEKKQDDNPAAGIFSALVALPLLCQIFEEEGALKNLENFTSFHGAAFYGLPPNSGNIALKKEPWTVPEIFEGVAVFMGGKSIPWKVC